MRPVRTRCVYRVHVCLLPRCGSVPMPLAGDSTRSWVIGQRPSPGGAASRRGGAPSSSWASMFGRSHAREWLATSFRVTVQASPRLSDGAVATALTMIDESWLLEKNGRTISSAVTGVKAGPSGPSKPGSDRADRSRLPGTARLDGAEPSGYLRSQAPPSGCRVGARSARVWAQASCSGR